MRIIGYTISVWPLEASKAPGQQQEPPVCGSCFLFIGYK